MGWLLLALVLLPGKVAAADALPRFTLAEHSLQVRCTSGIAIVRWKTETEENVAGFKVHRLSLDGSQPNGWVNPIPITARGSGGAYSTIDTQAAVGHPYLLRLYGFGEDYLLSKASQVVLAERAVPSCTALPVVMR